jgi:AcrR family transcriptional regulator
LLDAAEEVFGELTFDGASVAEITRRAGVAQGTFYVYFSDKKAAFVELVRELNHSMRREIVEALEGTTDRLEMERLGLKVFFDWVVRHRCLYKLVREAEFVDEEVYRWHYTRLAEGYSEGLRTAMDDGQIAPDIDAEVLAFVLLGIAEFAGMRWVMWEDEPPGDSVVDDIMTFVARGLGSEAASL